MRYEASVEYRLEQLNFNYAGIIAKYKGAPLDSLTPDDLTMLGISLFRLARFDDAYDVLSKAAEHNTEALIELQGCKLALFKMADAQLALEILLDEGGLSGFVRSMALRWHGVSCAINGNVGYGIGQLRQAHREFQGAGNRRGMQITSNMLGAALTMRGDYAEGRKHLLESLELSNPAHELAIWVDTGIKLFMNSVYTDQKAEADKTLQAMKVALRGVSQEASNYFVVQIKLCDALLARLNGKHGQFLKYMTEFGTLWLVNRHQHVEGLLWVGPLVLDEFSKTALRKGAHSILNKILPDRQMRPIPIRVVEGIIWLRDRHYKGAVDHLEQTMHAAQSGGYRIDAIRAQLYLADALYKANWPQDGVAHLHHALSLLVHEPQNFLIRDDLEQIVSVLIYAQLDPAIAQLIRIVQGKAAAPGKSSVHIKTFGKVEVTNQTVKWSLDETNVLLVLAYIKLHEECTIENIAKNVLSEKWRQNPSAANVYARRIIQLLRERYGAEQLIAIQDRPATPGRYRISDTFNVELDLLDAYEALRDQRIDDFFEIYSGRFAAWHDSVFAEQVNTDLEGAAYQYLRQAAKAAQTPERVHQVADWVRELLSVTAENDDVNALFEQVEGQERALRQVG